MTHIITAALLVAGGIAHAETVFVTLKKDNALAVGVEPEGIIDNPDGKPVGYALHTFFKAYRLIATLKRYAVRTLRFRIIRDLHDLS